MAKGNWARRVVRGKSPVVLVAIAAGAMFAVPAAGGLAAATDGGPGRGVDPREPVDGGSTAPA